MKLYRKLFLFLLLVLAFACNSCSVMYCIYFRNFTNKTLTIRVIDPPAWKKNFKKYYVCHAIIQMKRDIDLSRFDSLFVKYDNNDFLISIQPKSTTFLTAQGNNSSFMRNKEAVPQTTVLLEHNGQFLDTLTSPYGYRMNKKWKSMGGLILHDVIYYDFKDKKK